MSFNNPCYGSIWLNYILWKFSSFLYYFIQPKSSWVQILLKTSFLYALPCIVFMIDLDFLSIIEWLIGWLIRVKYRLKPIKNPAQDTTTKPSHYFTQKRKKANKSREYQVHIYKVYTRYTRPPLHRPIPAKLTSP